MTPVAKVAIVPCGIDTEAFLPMANPSNPRLLFVGRLVPQKGVDDLLVALAAAGVGEVDIVGDGPLAQNYRDRAIHLKLADRVRFLGRRPRDWIRTYGSGYRSKSWCESNDPDFAAKAADVVGLYMAPPKNAIVICVDEKPSIQALERAQGYLKLPNGRALTGHSHDYKRHGTTTLFAAFEVATGKVRAAHKKRRRRKEFLDFMDEVVADYPKARLKVILDNLNTHKKNDEWLKRHPLVTFHFTPTRASWLNQVECWFSILQGQSLNGASFTSVDQVKKHIDAFIKNYNEDAQPFVWTKSKVHQRRVKGCRLSDL